MLKKVGTSFLPIPNNLHKQMLNEKQSDKWPETSHDINLIALLPFNRSLEHLCVV